MSDVERIRNMWVEGQTEFMSAATGEDRGRIRAKLEAFFNEKCADRIAKEKARMS